jgi:hypothetical protein
MEHFEGEGHTAARDGRVETALMVNIKLERWEKGSGQKTLLNSSLMNACCALISIQP